MKKQDTNKRAEQIADAIGELPEQMICDALDFEEIKGKQKRKRRHRIEVLSGLAAAAILCIVVLHGSDRSFLQKQTADVDKTEEKVALKGTDQTKDASQVELDIWCMAFGTGEDATKYVDSDPQDQNTESSDVQKESGQKESLGDSKNEGTVQGKEKDSSGGEAGTVGAAKSDSLDTIGVSEQEGEQLQAGERQLLPTNITGKGENERVQFTLQFGATGDTARYQLKASGLSMELIARNHTAQKKITVQGNTKSKITCASGTQIGCSIVVSDMKHGTATPSITVIKENKDTGKQIKGKIKIEQKNGKYYQYLTDR